MWTVRCAGEARRWVRCYCPRGVDRGGMDAVAAVIGLGTPLTQMSFGLRWHPRQGCKAGGGEVQRPVASVLLAVEHL